MINTIKQEMFPAMEIDISADKTIGKRTYEENSDDDDIKAKKNVASTQG